MLAAHTMGSQSQSQSSRHQTLPFGCMDGNQDFHSNLSLIHADDPQEVHGMGLPSYMANPGRPGQPLLSERDAEGLSDLFSYVEGEAQRHHQPTLPGHFQEDMSQMHSFPMPQTYVGHETYLRSPQSMEWHSQPQPHPQHQSSGFHYPSHMNGMQGMQPPTSPFTNGHITSPVNPMFAMNQPAMQNYENQWQHPFPNHSILATRPDMQFGSDHNFSHHGYAAPDGAVEADMSLLTYAMAPASASTTQPNSRTGSNPNTEPSSPVVMKKRKLNAFQSEGLRMTSTKDLGVNGVTPRMSPTSPNSIRKPRKSLVKHEQQSTPHSKAPIVDDDEEQDEDAEYDDDAADHSMRSPSTSAPAPWPSSKARPHYKAPLPPKLPKPRKKSQSASSSIKPSMRRASSSTTAANRVPLTAEQKKANHTNSEQKRRDASARSFAELYDLVPELDENGKQSTMKKLEVVVDKVKDVQKRLEFLRHLSGRDIQTGEIISTGTMVQSQYPADMGHVWS